MCGSAESEYGGGRTTVGQKLLVIMLLWGGFALGYGIIRIEEILCIAAYRCFVNKCI